MCNAVLLSRVAQYYHPYFSMSAVTSPNNKSCQDTKNHLEEVKVLMKQQKVGQLHCFKNAQTHNFYEQTGRKSSRIDSRFPRVNTVSIQTNSSQNLSTIMNYSTIGCSNWPISKAITPKSLSELSSMNVSASVSKDEKICQNL